MDELAQIRKIFTESLPIFNALGDSNRQKLILMMLETEPKSVKELADRSQLSRPSISHHLKILKEAELIKEKKIGTRHYYHPNSGGHIIKMKQLMEEIDRLENVKKENR